MPRGKPSYSSPILRRLVGKESGNADAADKKECTRMARLHGHRAGHGRMQFGANPRESLLIGVHLRCHFLLRDQGRNRRRATIVILGRSICGEIAAATVARLHHTVMPGRRPGIRVCGNQRRKTWIPGLRPDDVEGKRVAGGDFGYFRASPEYLQTACRHSIRDADREPAPRRRYSRPMIGSALLFDCGNGCAVGRHGVSFIALISIAMSCRRQSSEDGHETREQRRAGLRLQPDQLEDPERRHRRCGRCAPCPRARTAPPR